jgi:aryl-alcohol dehydrogenase-like predicted oxidoreductase
MNLKKHKFGRTDLRVSELCLGTSNFARYVDQASATNSGPQLAKLLQKAASNIPPKITLASPPCSMPEVED